MKDLEDRELRREVMADMKKGRRLGYSSCDGWAAYNGNGGNSDIYGRNKQDDEEDLTWTPTISCLSIKYRGFCPTSGVKISHLQKRTARFQKSVSWLSKQSSMFWSKLHNSFTMNEYLIPIRPFLTYANTLCRNFEKI